MMEGIKAEKVTSGFNKFAAILFGVSVPSWLVAMFTVEELFLVLCILISIVAAFVVFCSWFPSCVTQPSSLVGGDGNEIRVPLVRGPVVTIAYILLLLVPTVGILWRAYGPEWMPTVSITRLEDSRIRYFLTKDTKGGRYRSAKHVPNCFFLTDMEGEEPVLATSAAIFTVARHGTFRFKSCRVESVEFEVTQIPFLSWMRKIGVSPSNFMSPFRCTITLDPSSRKVKGTFLDEESNPVDAIIALDDEHKTADIHVQATGKTGLYEITPLITVTDSTGRNRMTISVNAKVFVAVLNEDANKLRRGKEAIEESDPKE